jgi:hypothetical protein
MASIVLEPFHVSWKPETALGSCFNAFSSPNWTPLRQRNALASWKRRGEIQDT